MSRGWSSSCGSGVQNKKWNPRINCHTLVSNIFLLNQLPMVIFFLDEAWLTTAVCHILLGTNNVAEGRKATHLVEHSFWGSSLCLEGPRDLQGLQVLLDGSTKRKSMESGGQQLEPWLHCQAAVWPQASDSSFLCLSFILCKIKMVTIILISLFPPLTLTEA